MVRMLTLCITLLFSCSLLAKTTLWKVSKEGEYLYLAGTIHVLAHSDLPFPSAFDSAYLDSQIVVLETDMEAILDPKFQAQMMAQFSYSDGRLLNQVISPELYQELKQYLKERGLFPNLFIGMKPAGVMLTMLGIEFQRLGISADGADIVYYRKAVADGKQTQGLESIQEHIKFVAELGEGNEEQYLKQTLEDIKETESMMRDMVRAWKEGDVSALEHLVITEMQRDYPEVFQTLLIDRNLHWLPQIEQMMSTPETEIVLVGAAHLIGQKGILKMLENQGYTIEQL